MSDLWKVLAYDVEAAKIVRYLVESSDIVLLQGSPGVGKSWLATGIGVMWEEGGGSTVIAQGDIFSSEVPLFPLGFAMSNLSSAWRGVFAGLGGVARAGETLLGTGGLISASIDALLKARRSRRRGQRMVLGDAEQRILHDLERLSRKRPLLLIADNMHWWDARSLELLGRLRDPRMWDSFPFLSDMRVIAVATPEPYQRTINPEIQEAVLARGATRSINLPRIQRESFGGALKALGAGKDLSPELVDMIYHLTGGHLALAGRCATRIAKGDLGLLVDTADSEEFLKKILTERITAMGERGQQALTMLQIAAVMGLTFRRDELVCASGNDEPMIAQALRDCRTESVLSLDGGVGRFVHDLYRQYFLSAGPLDLVSVHERLQDCLRVLQPAEYELRCMNALKADRADEAASYAVQAALQRQRDGLPWRRLPGTVLEAMGTLRVVAETFETALHHINQYRFVECLESLAAIPRKLPRNLLAEADFLRASCLMTTRSEVDHASARMILEAWAGYEEEEPELGVRLLQLLLYGLAMIVDKEQGLKLEARLKRLLSNRANFDQAAEDAFYTLERCAGRFHVPERAVSVCQDAVKHFGPEPGQQVVRRPVEYYRCVVNLGAHLLANARYEECRKVYVDLAEFVSSYEPHTFAHMDYARMNALQADFRLGLVSTEEAVQRQLAIVAEDEVIGDPFYVENALAVYLALAGRYDDAIETLDELKTMLMRRQEPEPSQQYLIGANRCAVQYVSGDRLSALEEWVKLTDVLVRVPYVITPYLIRRHELLAGVMRRQEPMSAQEFDECLTTNVRLEFGPFWTQIGRGFRMPEVEWWR